MNIVMSSFEYNLCDTPYGGCAIHFHLAHCLNVPESQLTKCIIATTRRVIIRWCVKYSGEARSASNAQNHFE